MLSCKPILKCLRRKARFALCQMLLRPGQKGRQARRRFGRNLCYQHGDETAQPIEFSEFGQYCPKSGGSTIFDVLDARRQFVSSPLLLDPSLLSLALETLL